VNEGCCRDETVVAVIRYAVQTEVLLKAMLSLSLLPPYPSPLPRGKRVKLENQLRGERGQSQGNRRLHF